MINNEDQEALLTLISNHLKKDITCMAIGGTAMMFKGYKNATKDIDLVFDDEKDRKEFIKAIEALGYTKRSLKFIYDEKRTQDPDKPLLYSRGDERFDLFTKNVFGIELDINNFEQRQDFIGNKELIVLLPPKEILILMKSVTSREKDLEDIESIIKKEKEIDWNIIVSQAIKNSKNNKWFIIDLEETMQKLKKITLIKKEYFDKLFDALD